MNPNLKILTLKGKNILPYIPALAKLRMTIFREYPYLYDGDLDYENKYLNTYIQCPESIMVVVLDNEKVVGASSAIPLAYETEEMKQPFLDQPLPISEIFYFGESVLLPSYRGQKIYRHFFTQREEAARQYGSQWTAFAAVERAVDDPRKPENYGSLDKVWSSYGYKQHPELRAYLEWKEVGESAASAKPLVFWLKTGK